MKKTELPESNYEKRLKADVIAILTELQQEIEENVLVYDPNSLIPFIQARETCVAVIQQKINAYTMQQESEEV